METRRDEMVNQVAAFHSKYPIIWDLFVRFALEKINLGYTHYSVKAIFERIRWEMDAGGDGIISFKLNNNYPAFYSRRFMRMYPQHEGFFRTRHQISKDKSATQLPELTPNNYEYERGGNNA